MIRSAAALATNLAHGRRLSRFPAKVCFDEVAAWAKGIRALEADFVVLDAPGAMGAAFGASIAVADLVLIPSGATILDVRGAAETIRTVRQHRRASGKGQARYLIIPTRIDKRTSAAKEAVTTLAALTEAVSPVVSYRAIVANSLSSGESVATETPSASEFAALADAVLTRLGE